MSKDSLISDDVKRLNSEGPFQATCKGVARIVGKGGAIWKEATDSVTCFASEVARTAADRATAVVRGRNPPRGLGAKPPENIQDFMLILDPERTCEWHCNKKSNVHSRCKNEQQADFEVMLENIITDT